ncbi:peptidylprolyl isomerase [Actinophytocola oryzae]|uniref:[acyl-carrier-protein] S-malonyltransferase n=1 Tax=Actinophytocola oryzae TaxID=502181 RepID=A0A4R7VMB7_9PSEU|nr:peptidylprolyl isomerase [Actinophytocola oryzae]TDV50753.1 [acyl-carrier-protein] S-malonyltransferase [Actinophytocola oryzae]
MTVVARVAGTPIDVADVDGREAALRAGPVAPTLPRERTGEGRQLRRWLVQVLVAERLVAIEAAARGLGPGPELASIAPDRAAMLGLGSVAADLLARDPLARAVFVAVTDEVAVSDAAVERFYLDNPERFRVPEERVVWDGTTRWVLRRGERVGPVEDAVFAAAAGETVGPVWDPLGTHTFVVEDVRPGRVRSLEEAREEIEAFLLAPARRRAFTAWLDRGMAARVELAPGYEHPGDPGQPDNTHRH